MFQQIVIVLAILATVSARLFDREVYEAKFFDHVQKFKLVFGNGAEFIKRLEIFADNLDSIETHNKDTKQTYTLGNNK